MITSIPHSKMILFLDHVGFFNIIVPHNEKFKLVINNNITEENNYSLLEYVI